MENRTLTADRIQAFEQHLIQEEKSSVTIEKYLHDVRAFALHMNGQPVTKDAVLAYKSVLVEKYAVRSVNSKLASLCSLFGFLGWDDCKVKSLKIQRQTYSSEEKELTRAEYFRLIEAAKRRPRL